MPNLEGRWESLCKRLGIEPDYQMLGELMTRYGCLGTNRHYHTFQHINHMLAEFDEVRRLVINRDAIELAIWFHDAVYDTQAKDNEEQSANLFIAFAEKIGLSRELLTEVCRLILATKHDRIPTDTDAMFLCDIDLSILGQSEKMFDEYEEQIRKGYDWVPEEIFVKERQKILLVFLNPADPNHRIYRTEFFQKKYGEQAKKNLVRSINQLSSRLQS